MTTSWTDDELSKIGEAEEVQVSSVRRDGSLGRYVTIWVVRLGDDLYVRSAYGPDSKWFRGARTSRTGSVRAGGVTRDVTFEDADPGAWERIDDAYQAKYNRYASIVGQMVGEQFAPLTLRLLPR